LDLNKVYHRDWVEFMSELDVPVDLVVTSPPYADMRDYAEIDPDKYIEWFLPISNEIYRVLKDNGVFVLNIRNHIVRGERHPYVYGLVYELCKQFSLIEDYIWNKVKVLPNPKGRRGMDMWEFAFVFGKGTDVTWNVDSVRVPYGNRTVDRYKTDVKVRWGSDRRDRGLRKVELNPLGAFPKNILDIPSEAKKICHPAPFPVEFAEWFIKAYSNSGDLVYDPFGGGGSTAIAAQRHGRKWIMTEIHKEYVELANSRLADEPEALF
jgi:DNA modification methylase